MVFINTVFDGLGQVPDLFYESTRLYPMITYKHRLFIINIDILQMMKISLLMKCKQTPLLWHQICYVSSPNLKLQRKYNQFIMSTCKVSSKRCKKSRVYPPLFCSQLFPKRVDFFFKSAKQQPFFMNTAVYPRKELTFESTRKKVDSVGTTAVSYIVFMNTSSGFVKHLGLHLRQLVRCEWKFLAG